MNEQLGASDPHKIPDDLLLSMSVTATCFAVLLSAIEETLQIEKPKVASIFRKSLDKGMEALYEQSKGVDSEAPIRAQQWAAARRQILIYIRELLEDIRRH